MDSQLHQAPPLTERGMIQLQRVYDSGKGSKGEGTRFLVERLWPRGIKREALHFDAWLKDAAPSTELRQWFAHDPAKWKEFQRRYFAELGKKPETSEPILKALHQGPVTFLYSSHDAEHNNAVALKTYLTQHHKA
jgi:uncharacterized protein YeaO (DUF488 family)